MTSVSPVKAAGVGIFVQFVASLVWGLSLLDVQFDAVLRAIAFSLPAVAAFLAAFLARNGKVALGISMALWGALFGTLFNHVYASLGLRLDHIAGPIGLFLLVLGYQAVVCTLGSIAGFIASRYLGRREDAATR